MKKELSVYHITVIAVFLGLLLSFSIFYLTDILMEQNTVGEVCYDGTAFVGEDPLTRFNRTVYQNTGSLDLIHAYQYRLFGIVNDNLVVAGDHSFLFEVRDNATGYDYMEDYQGKCRFTPEEAAAILAELQRRQASYTERECEYLLVIIPNAQTVYSEYMPVYYGEMSRDTRLSVLGDYLVENGFIHFLDLTEDLKAAKSDGPLYNNTENTLNALGFYHVYQAVYRQFAPIVLENTVPLLREDLRFYQHMTAGKRAARKVGLADVVSNRTVSLSNDTTLNYRYLYNNGAASTTIRLPFYIPSEVSHSPELLLQFSGTWERLQIEPYFSNTFSKVTYQTDLSDDPAVFEGATPKVVIQFLYENELSLLLPQNTP